MRLHSAITIGIEVADASAVTTLNRVVGMVKGIYYLGGSGQISSNRVRGSVSYGMTLESTTGVDVSGNRVFEGLNEGIVLIRSSGNTIHNNDFSGNAGTDCVDDSPGPDSTWTNDIGDDSSPSGLCTAAP